MFRNADHTYVVADFADKQGMPIHKKFRDRDYHDGRNDRVDEKSGQYLLVERDLKEGEYLTGTILIMDSGGINPFRPIANVLNSATERVGRIVGRVPVVGDAFNELKGLQQQLVNDLTKEGHNFIGGFVVTVRAQNGKVIFEGTHTHGSMKNEGLYDQPANAVDGTRITSPVHYRLLNSCNYHCLVWVGAPMKERPIVSD
jgi:hypothetical protein